MKVLIGIPSKLEWVDRRQACIDTWLQECKVPYRFFLEESIEGYLSHKVQSMCKFALDEGYDYLFKCDDDTYVEVSRLLTSGFEKYDWVGRDCGHYTQGGAGYWLSRKALEVLANAPRSEWRSEDRWVGRVLLAAGISITSDNRYCNKGIMPEPLNDIISAHPCTVDKLHAIDINLRALQVS